LSIGGERQPLTTGSGNNYFPVGSPDGQTIAFISRRTGRPQIWLTDVNGSQPTQLTNDDRDIFGMSFSPDGQSIYFVASANGKGRLMRIPVKGGDALPLLRDRAIHLWA